MKISFRDVTSLASGLDAARGAECPDLQWLHASTRDPAPFWGALLDHHRASRRLEGRFEPYRDMVIAHRSDRPAFRWCDRGRGLLALSYEELHERAGKRAGEWAAQKVKAGDVVAVVLHPGPDWIVALLTALRMGLCLSFLPPLGDRFLARRLAALAPNHIVADRASIPLLAGFEDLVLREGVAAPFHADPPHAYAPDEVLGLVFSPLHAPLASPRKLTASAAHLGALRDSLFAYRVGPGDTLAAVGLHAQQHQPAMVFAALLAGAAYLHLTIEDVEADPGLIGRAGVRSMGVSTRARDALSEAQTGRPTGLAHWFRNPEEPFDPGAWRAFSKALRIDDLPSSRLLVDPSAGGCVLASVRRPGGDDWRLVPAPGRPFALYETNGSGDEAAGAHGLFAPKPAEKPEMDGHVILAENGAEYAYGGTLAPRRDGRVYPVDEVVEAVADLPFSRGAFVVAEPSGGAASRAIFTLVMFTGAERAEAAASAEAGRRGDVERAIAARLGEEFLPDRVRFSPTYPRMREGAIDAAWCEAQYRIGFLSRKARHPVFQALTALRGRCVAEATERG